MSRSHPWIALVVGVLLSVVFVLIAFRDVDPAAIREALARAEYSFLLPFLASLFLYYWVKTVRWVDLLSRVAQTTARAMFPAVMIGYAGSALLPLQLGELARAYIAGRKLERSPLAALMSIALERVLDLASILLLLGLALMSGDALPAPLIQAGFAIAALAVLAIALLLLYVWRTEWVLAVARRMTRMLPAALARSALSHLEQGVAGVLVMRDARLMTRLLALSLLQWLFMWACVWLSLAALGITATISATFLVLILMIIGISLPNSPGYVGSIQLAYVLALKPLGVDPADALAASIFFHVLAYVSVVLAGAVCLYRERIGIAGLRTALSGPARQ